MKTLSKNLMAALWLGAFAAVAHADDIKGVIEGLDAQNRTLTVQGITFHATADTEYEDGLKRFEDLQVGQRVEIDFESRDGRHIAEEIELDD